MYLKFLDAKESYHMAQDDYKRVLDRKKDAFNKTQPGAIKFDSERVVGGVANNMKWDDYVDKAIELDKELYALEQTVRARKFIYELSEEDLRNSKETADIIFVARFIERKKIFQIPAIVNYSESTVKRYLRDISANIKKRKVDTF